LGKEKKKKRKEKRNNKKESWEIKTKQKKTACFCA